MPRSFPWPGLIVLAALIFISVTSEFLPTGLLPEMSADLEVTESQVGMLITVFAGTVVATSIPLSILTRNRSRKSLVIVTLLVFVVANVLAALAPTFGLLVVARVLGGLAHGLFWGVVGAYAAHLVPAHQLGRAVAIMSGGGTAAFVLGVPVGTAFGHALGWRTSFLVIAALVLAFTVLAVKFLPPVDHRVTLTTGEIPLPVRKDGTMPAVLLTLLLLIVIGFGHNAFYTYVAPFLIGPVGISTGAVAGMLFLFGGAGALGLVASGMLIDRWPRASFAAFVALVGLSVLVLGLFAADTVTAIVAFAVFGFAFGGVPAMLQARLLRAASPRLRDLAAAGFTTSFNIAIAGGAYFGGVVLDRAGVAVLPFVEVGFIAAGLALIPLIDLRLRAVRTA